MTRRFTGYHMTAILLAFFGIVVAVNLVMATYATRTFGGVVVENSYVASQKFNSWLKEERAQANLGWNPKVEVDGQRRVAVSLAVPGAIVTGRAEHPLGRLPSVTLRFTGSGREFRSVQPLPTGRWKVHILVRRGGDTARLVEKLS